MPSRNHHPSSEGLPGSEHKRGYKLKKRALRGMGVVAATGVALGVASCGPGEEDPGNNRAPEATAPAVPGSEAEKQDNPETGSLETEVNPLGIPKEEFDNAIDIGTDQKLDPETVYPAGTAFDLNNGMKIYIRDTIYANEAIAEFNGPDYSPHRDITEGNTAYIMPEIAVLVEEDHPDLTMNTGHVLSNVHGNVDFVYVSAEGEEVGTFAFADYPESHFRFGEQYGDDIESYPEVGEVISGYGVPLEISAGAIEGGKWVISDIREHVDPNDVAFQDVSIESSLKDAPEAPATDAEKDSLPNSVELPEHDMRIATGEVLRGDAAFKLVTDVWGEDGHGQISPDHEYFAVLIEAGSVSGDPTDNLIWHADLRLVGKDTGEEVAAYPYAIVTPDGKDPFLEYEGGGRTDYDVYAVYQAKSDKLNGGVVIQLKKKEGGPQFETVELAVNTST